MVTTVTAVLCNLTTDPSQVVPTHGLRLPACHHHPPMGERPPQPRGGANHGAVYQGEAQAAGAQLLGGGDLSFKITLRKIIYLITFKNCKITMGRPNLQGPNSWGGGNNFSSIIGNISFKITLKIIFSILLIIRIFRGPPPGGGG